MCGILATYAAKNAVKTGRVIARALLIDNQERGTDSTGICYPERGGLKMVKATIPAVEFTMKKSSVISSIQSRVILGHTRLGTTGIISERNAHPFVYENMALIHNGMISNHVSLAKELSFNNYEVDSEILLPIFRRRLWKKLGKVSGQAAVIAYDNENGLLYFFRHNNPLYIVKNENGVFLSSRATQLYIQTGTQPEPVKEDIVYSVDNALNVKQVKKIHFTSYDITELYSSPYGTWDDAPAKTDYSCICDCCGVDCTWYELQRSYDATNMPLCQMCLPDFLSDDDEKIDNLLCNDYE